MHLSNKGLRLDEIETFVAIMEAGSMIEAARRLSISASVVSKRINNLEAALGERLLQRSTRSLGATEAGEVFYGRALQVLNDLNEAADAVSSKATALSGPIRLAAPLSFSLSHLSPLLLKFATAHPDVTLKVDTDDRFVDLMSEGYDLALRLGRLEDSALIARRVTISRRALVCSPGFASKHGLPASLSDLDGMRAVTYGHRSISQQWRFATAGGELSAQPVSVFEATNGDIQRDAAVDGLGITILPTFLCAGAVERGDLIQVSLTDAKPTAEPVHAVFPQNRYLSRRVRALVDSFAEAFGDNPSWDKAFKT